MNDFNELDILYYTKLGRFMHSCANLEQLMHVALREYSLDCSQAKDRDRLFIVFQSIFGEMRIKTVSENIARLTEIFEPKKHPRLKPILDHIGEIFTVRDKLAHKPNMGQIIGDRLQVRIYTVATANRAERTEELSFDLSVIDDLIHDLTIAGSKVWQSLGLKIPNDEYKKDYEQFKDQSWRYKPSQLKRKQGLYESGIQERLGELPASAE